MTKAIEVDSGEMRVVGETIQDIYRKYVAETYLVNRRYQRKLVWTAEQKEKLIDSIASGLPIPLILLADRSEGGKTGSKVEVIDGLQRLHTITSFINNDFSWNDHYFDLDTLAQTKARKDDPNDPLEQKKPVLSREKSVEIAIYQVPVSSYVAGTNEVVDEVFRRINSSGRQLSRQEVRQAGITCTLATLVRKISSEIRDDGTRMDVLPLSEISAISIKSMTDQGPGILIDNIFWVKQGILIRDDLRGSLDEQLVLDLILDVLEMKEPVSTTARNRAYEIDSDLGARVNAKISRLGPSRVQEDVHQIFSNIYELCTHIEGQGEYPNLMQLMGRSGSNSVGRYFHVLFMSVYRLVKDGKKLTNIDQLARDITNYWAGEGSKLPGGSTWTYAERSKEITKLRRQISDCFSEDDSPEVVALRNQIELFRKQTHSYLIENELFELKAGLLEMNPKSYNTGKKPTIPNHIFDKIIKECAAIANFDPTSEGSLYLGVVDSEDDANKVSDIFGVSPLIYDTAEYSHPFQIVGIDHELDALRESLDEYVSRIIRKIRDSKLIDDSEFKNKLASGVRPIPVMGSEGDRRTLISIRIEPVGRLVHFDGSTFGKSGSDCIELRGQDLILKYQQFQNASL